MLTTKMGPDGRVLVPVSVRRAVGFEPGTTLVARAEDGRIVLESRDAILSRVQDRFANAIPRDVSLSDELIAERRREAERENG